MSETLMSFKLGDDGKSIIFSNMELFLIRLMPLELKKSDMQVFFSISENDWAQIEVSIFRKLEVTNWAVAILKCFEMNILHKNQYADPISKTLSVKYAEMVCESYDKTIDTARLEEIIKLYFDEIINESSLKNNTIDFEDDFSKSENFYKAFNAYRRKIREKLLEDLKPINDQAFYIEQAKNSINKLFTQKDASANALIDVIAFFLKKSFNDWDYSNISKYSKNFNVPILKIKMI